ncbi:recombinase family protein [Enterococcus faecium]|nr:recombinase family protein [Enterococcus faecium]
MRVAYIRVSSIDQNEQRQIEEMKNSVQREFSSRNNLATITQRPVFQEALDFVRDQDILLWKLLIDLDEITTRSSLQSIT